MKVFISWSGETSKNIAEIFRQWLPSVIQVVKPYYSPDDIAKGARWSSEIASELDDSKIGLICLTKDNLSSSWIMFEAGALSKNIENSKVCPLLFGVEPSDIQGPLVQFQAAKFAKDEMKKVVRMMNLELGENSLTPEVFETVFEMWWPKLQERIELELAKPKKASGTDVRSERDILEEILSLSRNITFEQSRDFREGRNIIHPQAINDSISAYISVVGSIIEDDRRESVIALEKLFKPLDYLLTRSTMSEAEKTTLRRDLDMTYRRLTSYDSDNGFHVMRSKPDRVISRVKKSMETDNKN